MVILIPTIIQPDSFVHRMHMIIAQTTLWECSHAKPTDMYVATTACHMIATLNLLYRGAAFGTVFDSVFLLVFRKFFMAARTE